MAKSKNTPNTPETVIDKLFAADAELESRVKADLSSQGIAVDDMGRRVKDAITLAKLTGDTLNVNVEDLKHSVARDSSSAQDQSSNNIDWRSRIKPEFIVLNREKKDRLEKITGKPFGEIDPQTVPDDYKLILLGGFRSVAEEKGFESAVADIITDTREYVTVKYTIKWSDGVTSTGFGNSHLGNTDSFMSNFLVTSAENRAFVRCVRNYLKIPIMGKDEIDPEASEKPQPQKAFAGISPINILKSKLDEKGRTFEQFQLWYAGINPAANTWMSYSDIPVSEVHTILAKLKVAPAK